MTIAGTIYGVILNDSAELSRLAPAFTEKPYQAPPRAPVVYIKPRACLRLGDASVPVPAEFPELEAAPTLALLFARDVCGVDEGSAMSHVGAACLALDISVPQANYYRPAIAQRCRDGFLPLGGFGAPAGSADMATSVDGVEVHRWSTDRLLRAIPTLIRDLTAFMTLRAGDLLLVGLPGDAPRVRIGQSVSVAASGLPTLATVFAGARS